jgi:hypothetical protein
VKYFARLNPSRMVLWCYLLWYVFFAVRYFDASSALWLTSVGISAIVGVALLLSTWHAEARLWSWTTFRLFLMPFCVSSFSALVKGKGFVLIFSPHDWENGVAGGLCVLFCLVVGAMKLVARATAPRPGEFGTEPTEEKRSGAE